MNNSSQSAADRTTTIATYLVLVILTQVLLSSVVGSQAVDHRRRAVSALVVAICGAYALRSRSRYRYVPLLILLCIRNILPVILGMVASFFRSSWSRKAAFVVAGAIPLLVAGGLLMSWWQGGYHSPTPAYIQVVHWSSESPLWILAALLVYALRRRGIQSDRPST